MKPTCFVVVCNGYFVDKELHLVHPDSALGSRVRCFHTSPVIGQELVEEFNASNPKWKAEMKEARATFTTHDLDEALLQRVANAKRPERPRRGAA